MIFYQRGWYLLNLGLFGFILCETTNFILVQHLELPQYFNDISRSNPQSEFGRIFRNLRRREKIAKCQQTLNAVIYRSLPSDQTLSPPSNPNMKNLLRDVENSHYSDVLSGIQLIEVTLQLPGRVVLVPALPCILHVKFFWFITPGFQSDEFFILEKQATDKNFYLHGIIEPRATINEVISYDQLRLEVHFLKNYRLAARKRKKANFCDLDNFQTLRLCSSAHVMWRALTKRPYFQANLVHNNAYACVENAVVSFEKITQENTGFEEPIVVDLVSCAINTPHDDPQFYLAADQNISDSSYVLQEHRSKDNELTYRLFIHLKDIPPLARDRRVIQTHREYETEDASS